MGGNTSQAAHRSDAAVCAEARRDLDKCPTVQGTARLPVEGGLATLTGSVPRPSQRADAEHVVRPVIGDRRLLNNITVDQDPSREGFERPDDRG